MDILVCGSRVKKKNTNLRGKIMSKKYNAYKIKWDNNKEGIYWLGELENEKKEKKSFYK